MPSALAFLFPFSHFSSLLFSGELVYQSAKAANNLSYYRMTQTKS